MPANTIAQTTRPQSSAKASLMFWLFWHGLALLIVLAVLLVVVPKFDKMFEEFGLKLPVLSALIVRASRILRSYGVAIVPLGVVFHMGMLCLVTLVEGVPRWLRNLWCLGVLAVAGGILVLIAIGMFLPLLALIQGLS